MALRFLNILLLLFITYGSAWKESSSSPRFPVELAASTRGQTYREVLTTTSRRDAVTRIAKLGGGLVISLLVGKQRPAFAVDAPSDYQDGPNGLKYKVLTEGAGDKPQRGQKVKTSYTLYLDGFPEDGGKQVDSSKRLVGDKPFEFACGVSQVVKGWDYALMDMKEGESRRLIVPSDLGYGDKGFSKVPGKSTLYFDVTLSSLGKMPELNDEQKKWLDEHPLYD